MAKRNFTEHNFDFNDAMTMAEFFTSKGVEGKERKFLLKTHTPNLKDESGNDILDEDGQPIKDTERAFMALGLSNGETTDDGRPAMGWFTLSGKLSDEGVVLNKAFLKEHVNDLQLLEPIDGLKYGIAFLSSGAEDFDSLFD